jgi:8-oxo-dGTP pyrophosphatase MutT (NUDIX family)
MEKRNILAAGGLVTNSTGALLMIYRRGKWDLPKGKWDIGETIEACAVREVMEETGLTSLNLGQLIHTSYHTYFDQYLQEEVVKETHWFAMTADEKQPLIPQTEEDITDIQWVSVNEIAQRLADSYPNIVDTIRMAGLA